MKINTDGTLLAVLSEKKDAATILDIGTGTGVVALMLAQRFPNARIDAVEIDEIAALTAERNFKNSVFADRLTLHPSSFQEFSSLHPLQKYDLIVSNPPFFINSLKNPDKKKQTARHTDLLFFSQIIDFANNHLQTGGVFSLILPIDTALEVKAMAVSSGLLYIGKINIRSFENSEAHREILNFSTVESTILENDFVIYSTQKQYSGEFVNKLTDFFSIF
jgi:tRNA1Val (adenine37-N6)-methyltransferase